MVAALLRLRISILGSGFRRGPARAIGVGLLLLVVLAAGAAAVAGILELAAALSPRNAFPFVVVAGSALVGLVIATPFSRGGVDEFEPRRFLAFRPSTAPLALGTALVGLLGVPALLLTALLLAVGLAWAPVAFALGVAVLSLLAIVLLVRISSVLAATVASGLPARRRGGVVLAILIAASVLGLVVLSVMNWRWGTGFAVFTDIASALGWTPFGAPWSAPLLVAQGQWSTALGQVAVLGGTLLIAVAAWVLVVRWSLTTRRRERVSASDPGLGWFARTPGTRAGAVAARSLTYWGRDDRYRVAWRVVPVFAVVVPAMFLVAGMPLEQAVLIPLPLAAWFLGWLPHNDVSSDHSAFWLHVSAGVDGSADRWGRVIPPLAVGVPGVLGGSLLIGFFAGGAAVAVAIGGISLGLLLAGLGASSILSVRLPYATVQPGRDPFRQPQLTTGDAMTAQFAGFGASAVVIAPALAALYLGLTGAEAWLLLAGGGGLLLGAAAFLGGLRWGSRRYDARGPELLSAVQRG